MDGHKFIDVSENKRLVSTSPFAVFGWLAILVIASAFWRKPDFVLFMLFNTVSFVITQVIFSYKPRFILLTLRSLSKNPHLTTAFQDKDYLNDPLLLEEVKKAISNAEIKRIKESE